jgi:hypothetical protein
VSGLDNVIRELWVARVQIARPNAGTRDVLRAVDSIMRDPQGGYAKEIRDTAERVMKRHWIAMDAPPNRPDERSE